jgi:hypothetical protein
MAADDSRADALAAALGRSNEITNRWRETEREFTA